MKKERMDHKTRKEKVYLFLSKLEQYVNDEIDIEEAVSIEKELIEDCDKIIDS